MRPLQDNLNAVTQRLKQIDAEMKAIIDGVCDCADPNARWCELYEEMTGLEEEFFAHRAALKQTPIPRKPR